MHYRVWPALGVVTICWVTAGQSEEKPVDFAHAVVPVLKKHCVECHGGKEVKGGFSLNTRDLVLESDAATPGKANESRLIELVESSDPEEQMPPNDRPRLTKHETAVLRNWIEQGLPWEPGFTFAEKHYEPPLRPRRPELPPAVDGRSNPVDRIVDAYLAQHKLPRPPAAADALFLRRVYLDVIGLVPEPQVLESFLRDHSTNKRQRVIRELLQDNLAYTEHWLTFWNDLLRNDYSGTGFITGGRKQITPWLYASLISNKPYDQLARELIVPTEASEGFTMGIRWRGNVNASQTPEIQFAQNVGQAFLGINLKCASCHDSFIDRWTLEETYGLAQIYSQQPLTLHRCDKPLNKTAKAAWLFPELGQVDASADQPTRLKQLANLLTHPENGRFTRTIVNRIWHRLMGRGIVHPVDAMHTEPWSADLLDYLAADLADNNYDLKQTIELICNSHAYQAQTPATSESATNQYTFRGPTARRMTAEQLMDVVWQITGAAPAQFDAPVVRVDAASTGSPMPPDTPATAKWIWSAIDDPNGNVPHGQTLTFRRTFKLRSVPTRAVATVSCDNEYTMYVNGRLAQSDDNWETVELINLQPHLRVGQNEILVVATNGGTSPNPAGLYFNAHLGAEAELSEPIGTDGKWQWSVAQPDARGRLRKDPGDWAAAVIAKNQAIWNSRIGRTLAETLQVAASAPNRMVRASLLKNNAFLSSLGRPTRDQIVSMRPSELTTLEAIDLANGQILADAIAAGAERLRRGANGSLDASPPTAEELTHWLYQFALSRPPTSDEAQLVSELLGDETTPDKIEDLLWSVFMLPEFQLVR